MEKLDGCTDAYLDPKDGITLAFAADNMPDEKALQTLLAPFKIKPRDLKRANELPY